MTTLDAYATFLTARWDEVEAEEWHAADCERNTYSAGPCDCGVPALATADLASKRAILGKAHEALRFAARPSAGRSSRVCAATFIVVLEDLAEPFRTHPEHPENRKAT